MPRMHPVRYLLATAVVLVSGVTATAQFPRERPPLPGAARIVSGDDLGFRVEGTDPRTGNPTGTWMIRMNGNWVEIGAIGVIKPAK